MKRAYRETVAGWEAGQSGRGERGRAAGRGAAGRTSSLPKSPASPNSEGVREACEASSPKPPSKSSRSSPNPPSKSAPKSGVELEAGGGADGADGGVGFVLTNDCTSVSLRVAISRSDFRSPGSESTSRYMATAMSTIPSLSRMLAALTSMPARTDNAYAASKQAHADLKSPEAFDVFPLSRSIRTFSSRDATVPVNADVGIAAVICAVGTSTGALPTFRSMVPARFTLAASVRCTWLPIFVVNTSDIGISLIWWMKILLATDAVW